MFPGIGTLVNVATVLVGSAIGVLAGHRLTERTRDVVTDGLGLVTLLIAALDRRSTSGPALVDAVGHQAPVLIVLGALVLGGVIGSLLRHRGPARALRGLAPGAGCVRERTATAGPASGSSRASSRRRCSSASAR